MECDILIFGGTGFISLNLVNEMCKISNKIIVVSRGTDSEKLPKGVIILKADRNNVEQFRNTIEDIIPMVIFDFSCFEPHHLESTQFFLDKPDVNYVFMSSVYVYDHLSSIKYNLSKQERYMKSISTDEPRLADKWYGRNKVTCEDILLDAKNKAKIYILRLAYVLGSLNSNFAREKFFIKRMNYSRTIYLPFGGRYIVPFVHVSTVVKFCKMIYENRIETGVYNLANPDSLTLNEYVNFLGKAFDFSLIIKSYDYFVDDHLFNEYMSTPYAFPQDIRYETTSVTYVERTDWDNILISETIENCLSYGADNLKFNDSEEKKYSKVYQLLRRYNE